MSLIPGSMASGTAKEERKRKRTKDGEGDRHKTKKAKGEKMAKETPAANGAGSESIPSAGPQGSTPEARTDAAKLRKDKASRRSLDSTQEVQDSPRDKKGRQKKESIGEFETREGGDDVDAEEDKLQRRQHSLERQYQELVLKFRTVEDLPPDSRARELQWLLQKSKKIIKKRNLAQDDELVALRDRHANARRELWQLSRSTGGRYLDCGPVFSKDEKYIILATANSIHVYEAQSSLLLRTMYAHGTTCYALSAVNPHHLYVGTFDGDIHHFDWTTSERLRSIAAGRAVHIRSILAFCTVETNDEFLLTVETQAQSDEDDRSDPKNKTEKKSKFSKDVAAKDAVVIRKAPWDQDDQTRQELIQGDFIRHLQILDQGRVIIAASTNKMLIGSISTDIDLSSSSLANLKTKIHWRHLNAVHAMTCLDAHARNQTLQDKSGQRTESRSYDVAVGNAKGELLIYEDIVTQLDKPAEGSNQPPRARSLRWHREAPNAVKWSNDGNYLISGGKETVLCIWQLETGRRQDLPHLGAAIQSLTVSPSGTSYAIHLTDNSVLVISTAELQPKTHIAGLQSLCVLPRSPFSQVAKKSYTATPFVNNPRNPNDVLLAVPLDQRVTDRTGSTPAAPFLQTYNLQAGRHKTRQALTRNLVTEAGIDPDWNKIEIPNVTFIQISYDGLWLATVEEWLPPAHALQHLALDKKEVEVERLKRRETYLKIWSWNEEGKIWELNTRVSKPHVDDANEKANRTFHLVAHPTQACFATVGEDSCMRAWRPRATIEGQTSWHAKVVSKLERSAVMVDEATDFLLPATPITGRLAYSNDGSVIAVSQQDDSKPDGSVVHLLDAKRGTIKNAETGLVAGYLVAMEFLDRYLILVSDELRIWDAVIGSMVFSKYVGGHGLSLTQRLATTHLAISTASGSFAVAGVNIGAKKNGASSVSVFKPTLAEPLFTSQLSTGAISSLSTLVDGTGYVILNSQAELRTLTTHSIPILGGKRNTLIEAQAEGHNTDRRDDDDDDDDEAPNAEQISTAKDGSNRAVRPLAIHDDGQVLKSDELAHVFAPSSGSLGLPSVKEMFESVAGLFSSKAR